MKNRFTYFTDLDSTIICNKKELGTICVAEKNGKPSSFLKIEDIIDLYELSRRISIIPITTRCQQSYENIYIKSLFRYALVDNGARFISNSKIESEQWLQQSRQIISNDKTYFDKARTLIEHYGLIEKWGSEFVLDYIIDESKPYIDPHQIAKELKEYNDVLLINPRKKSMVCTYKKLSKGVAIERYCDLFSCIPFLSSGDGEEDISMFERTKHSIGIKDKSNAEILIPNGLNKLNTCHNFITEAKHIVEKIL